MMVRVIATETYESNDPIRHRGERIIDHWVKQATSEATAEEWVVTRWRAQGKQIKDVRCEVVPPQRQSSKKKG